MEDPPFGRDRTSYKEQRRKSGGDVSKNIKDGNADDGMFFGTSPMERKDLRETVDKRKIGLDDLDLNAVNREKFTDVPQVGQTLRLIDMAMGADETPGPKRPAVKRPPGAPRMPPTRALSRPPPPPRTAKPTRSAKPSRPAPGPAKPGRAQPARPPAKPARPAANSAPKKPAKPTRSPPQPAPKKPAGTAGKAGKAGKGMKISDMGLKVTPRKVGKPTPKKRPR